MQIFSLDFPRSRIFWLLVFLPVLFLSLSACGGGGGGSSDFSSGSTSSGDIPSTTSGGQSVTDSGAGEGASNSGSQNTGNSNPNSNPSSGSPQSAFSFPSKAKVPEVSSAIWEAAKISIPNFLRNSINNQSNPVSLTQTSQPTTHGTGDYVLLEWLYTPTGDFTGERRLWASFYTDGRGRGLLGQRERSVSDIVQTEIRQVNDHAWADMAMYRRWTADDADNHQYFDRYAAFGSGEVWVYAYTDADGDGDGTPGEQSDREDSDYLTGGVWVYVPETFVACDNTQSSPVCNEHEVGVFASGNDPFDTNVWVLEGTASYDGRAVGIFTGTAGQTYFRANTEITVYFGDSSDTGNVRGRIFDFVGENGSRMSGNPVVQLESRLSIDAKYFFGETSHNDGTDDFTGDWTGHFYGNDHTSGTPTSLGGTFGVSTSDGSKVYLGAFGSHLDTYDATDFTLP